MTAARRRQPGEGSISQYQTKAGPRFLAKYSYTADDGTRKQALKRGFPTRKAAADYLRERVTSVQRGEHVAPNRVTVEEHFAAWLDGLRQQPSTVASYRKNVRLHVVPHIGALRLEQLTGTRLTKLYRHLETAGRADGQGGLSPRTVRYVHTIVHAGLRAAVRDGLVLSNAADKADPPSAKAAASPEMTFWTAPQLATFLRHDPQHELAMAWRLLANTGMRRGEALALRWSDVDWTAGRISVQRAVGVVKTKGAGEELHFGKPKSGRARVVDLDPATLAALRSYRAQRAEVALTLAKDDALVLGTIDGAVRHPERFSRAWQTAVTRARRDLPDLPAIRLHDLRHTHATIMLGAGIPVKVVSERLGHANATITLGVYAHVMPGMQAEAASLFANLIAEEA
ncbi:site-specific integrase [Janibacter melonis]|uniref:tyrosine-type recombinase/integrase n=1 Tax=Janibacter melonis TaxID=262209 RepID=UPI0020445DEA|nr:site-specific integrase [Janibacter melonis]MCM3554522.1 site-specific integrase [Janibacter melonis]